MANINLNIDMITKESLRVLHQKMNFISNCTKGYDDSYAVSGAKIGNTLRIRLPIQYSTGTVATINTGSVADTIQTSTTLPITSRRNIPMRFTTEEMTLDIDEFSDRHVKPAMTKLAAMVENNCIATAMTGTAQLHNTEATAVAYKDIMEMRRILQESLTPEDARTILLDPQACVDLNDALKGLYNDSKSISKMYLEGMITRAQGFDFFENTMLPDYTSGAEDTTDDAYEVAAGSDMEKTLTAASNDPNTMTLTVDTGTKTITNGQIFTIDSVFDCHPETKATRGALKRFTVVAGGQASATSLTITPAIIASGPHQNVSAAAAENDDLVFLNANASTTFHQSLAFQKGAFAFATADLFKPPREDCSRQVFDGISMRMINQSYAVLTDKLVTRLDILYGFKVIRPDLAVKLWHI